MLDMDSPFTDISTPTSFDQESESKSTSLLLKLAKGFLLLVFILLTISFAIATFFEDEIKEKLVDAINDQLKSELEVESFQLSLIKGFPNVSANFTNVVLDGTFQSNTAPLLEASSLSFTVPLVQLLSDNIQVKSVLIENGAVSIYVNSKGKPNYKILKSTSDSKRAENFQLDIEEAIFSNVEIIYTNKGTDITSRVRIDDASLSGNFRADNYALKSIGKGESYFLDIADKRFVPGHEINFDFILDIDMNKNLYAFEKGDLTLDDNKFHITGDIINDPEGYIYDIKAKSKDGNLASAFTLLPAQYLEYFNDIKSTGTFLFDLTYKGQETDEENPKLTARMHLKKGQIKSPLLSKPIKNVNFTASFNNGKYRSLKSSIIQVSNFKGYFNKELTQMELDIYNLEDPSIDLELDGTIPVNSLYKFLHKDMLSDAQGELDIKNLKVRGKHADMSSMSGISKVKVSGDIVFKKAGLSVNDYPFVAQKGILSLKGNNIQVKELALTGADSDATISGSFKNLIPVMFADSLNSQNAELSFESKLVSQNMDLDQLVDAFKTKDTEEEEDNDTGWHSKISGFLNGTFDAYVKQLNYGKLKGQEFEGSLDFEDDILTIDGDVEAMDGSMAIEGELSLTKTPKLVGEIEAKNIDVYALFDQANNFGQSTILAENIQGRMNSNMIINAYFDERGTFLTDKLHVYAGMEIHDGELVELDLLNSFDKFVKTEDLQHIQFTKLENWFEIHRGKIHIPVMFIQSNALNMEVSGTHTFDHDINYNVKINPMQIIASKLKKHNRTRRPQKDQRGGLIQWHYTIRGTVDDYVVNKNKSAVQDNFVTSKYKKDKIRSVLEDSFGAFDLNSSVATNVKKKPVAKPEVKKETPAPKPQEEIIQAQVDDEVLLDFEVEDEEDTEYIQFQGDDGD